MRLTSKDKLFIKRLFYKQASYTQEDIKKLLIMCYYHETSIGSREQAMDRKLKVFPIFELEGSFYGAVILLEGTPPKGSFYVDMHGCCYLPEYKGWTGLTGEADYKTAIHNILYTFAKEYIKNHEPKQSN